MNYKVIVASFITGLLVGLGLFYAFGNRYEIRAMNNQGFIVKYDKFTGEAWTYFDREDGKPTFYWHKMDQYFKWDENE